MPIGSTAGFKNINPDGTPTTPPLTNQLVNFGWEYVWHCHILSHEEMDMMRPMKFNVPRALAAAPVLTGGQGASAVNLTWTDGTPFTYGTGLPASTLGNPANEIGFRIERAAGNGAFSAIGTALANATTFADSTVPVSGPYRYRVTAYNAAGDSVSNIVTIDTTVLAPAITAISPASGPISGGTSVVITGTGLTGATAVSFGATPTTGFTVNSATQITATAPAGAAGTVDVAVTTAGGTSAVSAADRYTYVATPTVTGLAPSSGPISGGTSVVITGTGLTGATAVSFGATPTTGFTVNSATQITATAPAGAAGTVDVTVTTVGVTSAVSASDRYTYVLATNRYEQTDSRILYTPAPPSTVWATFATASASGGSYARTSAAGAYVVIPFNGQSLDVIATKGTTLSKADFSVDGGPVTTVDLANSVVQYQVKVFSTGTLPAGNHWVKIARNPTDVAGKFISLDRVDVQGALLAVTKSEQNYQITAGTSAIAYTPASAWPTFGATGASGGSYIRANTSGSQATIKFNGIRFDWIATKGTTLGKGDVYLDGVLAATVNLAASAVAYQQNVWSTGFITSGVHTVVIKWNTTNAAGKYISLDRADTWGPLQQAP